MILQMQEASIFQKAQSIYDNACIYESYEVLSTHAYFASISKIRKDSVFIT